MNIDEALEYAQNALERAFEDWLESEQPSGDCESVHRQWDSSSAHLELVDELQPAMALTAEVRRLREDAASTAGKIIKMTIEHDWALGEAKRLREENERLRVQLAGCGVAAMQNTADSREHRITRDDYGWSASYADVCSAVDREISLREENERLRKDADVGYAIERAAAELPAGYIVGISIESGAATVDLGLPTGHIKNMDVDGDNRLAAEINAAIDAARGAK